MKRVKVMLTAVMVLAVVGGALAFKAKRFNTSCYYSSTVKDACAFIGQGTTIGSVVTTGDFNTTKSKVNGVCPNQTGTVLCPDKHATGVEP